MGFESAEVNLNDLVVLGATVSAKEVVGIRRVGNLLGGQSDGATVSGVEVRDVGLGEGEDGCCRADLSSHFENISTEL